MKLGIDLDGDAYDFVGALRRHLNLHHGFPLARMPDPTAWEFWSEWGLSFERWKWLFDEGVERGYIFRDGPPVPGCVRVLEYLQSEGHTVHLITMRPQKGAIFSTAAWLEEYGVPYDSLTFAGYKPFVDFDILLDDYVPHCTDTLSVRKKAVLYSMTHNRNEGWEGPEVEDWDQFYDFVNRFAR